MLKAGILILCVIHYVHSASDRPRCPIWLNNKPNPGFPVCDRYRNQCNSDKECKKGQLCCLNPSCGRTCQAPVSKCPPVCTISCPFGNVLNENFCPTCKCNTGCAGNVKPLSMTCGAGILRCPGNYQCNTPPGGGDGVCCPIRTDLACEKGTPQGTCKTGPFPSTPCPSGTYCKNSVCCKIPCDYGDPHPTRFCGMIVSSNKCPTGYHCKGGPADEYHACCPNAKTTKIGRCPRDKYPQTKCYVQRNCKNDASCPGTKKCCKQGCRYKCVYPVD